MVLLGRVGLRRASMVLDYGVMMTPLPFLTIIRWCWSQPRHGCSWRTSSLLCPLLEQVRAKRRRWAHDDGGERQQYVL